MKLAKYIDQTLLQPDATREKLDAFLEEAMEYDFFSVAINPCNIEYAKKKLEGSTVKLDIAIGFPLGQMSTEAKAFEAKDAIAKGADEIDMVINVARLKDKDYDYVVNEINEVKKACGDHILKVIFETSLLNDEEIVSACECALKSNCDYVKTSTGFSSAGANYHNIELMAKTLQGKKKIKASAGIKDKADFLHYIELGCDRIGTSRGPKLLQD